MIANVCRSVESRSLASNLSGTVAVEPAGMNRIEFGSLVQLPDRSELVSLQLPLRYVDESEFLKLPRLAISFASAENVLPCVLPSTGLGYESFSVRPYDLRAESTRIAHTPTIAIPVLDRRINTIGMQEQTRQLFQLESLPPTEPIEAQYFRVFPAK